MSAATIYKSDLPAYLDSPLHSNDIPYNVTEITAIFVPGFILRNATRHKVTLTEVFSSWENFKKYVSQADRIAFFAMNSDRFFQVLMNQNRIVRNKDELVAALSDSYQCRILRLLNLHKGLTASAEYEEYLIEQKLSMSDEYFNQLLTRMTEHAAPVDPVITSSSTVPVTKAIDRNTIALVIDDGQLAINQDTGVSRFDYVRAVELVLKELYASLSPAVVQATVWYKLYVKLLAGQVVFED